MDNRTVDSKKVASSFTWSGLAEIMAKLVAPISSMILARLLTPEAFGVVASVSVIISFSDMFTDAGFQQFIIQHEFSDESALEKNLNVAFWSNFCLSLLLAFCIAIFRRPLAALVGSPGMGKVLAIAGLAIPLTSFSSLQNAYLKRKLNFKPLFYARMAAVAVPLFITVPLSFLLRNHWALIAGTLTVNVLNAVLLTAFSEWKPRFYYSLDLLKEMLGFSLWMLAESFLIWLTTYIGTFIVGRYLSTYYIGIFKNSLNTVRQITDLVVCSTVPVVFSVLSRLQNDREAFLSTFLKFQKMISLVALPMGVGMLLYRRLITDIMLGSQWGDAVNFIGLWSLMICLCIPFGDYISVVYRAMGKLQLSVFSKSLYLLLLVPLTVYGASRGFETLYVLYSLSRLWAIAVDVTVLWMAVRISPWRMLANMRQYILAAAAMSAAALVLQQVSGKTLWSLFSIVLCMAAYFAVVLLSKQERSTVMMLAKPVIRKIKKK